MVLVLMYSSSSQQCSVACQLIRHVFSVSCLNVCQLPNFLQATELWSSLENDQCKFYMCQQVTQTLSLGQEEVVKGRTPMLSFPPQTFLVFLSVGNTFIVLVWCRDRRRRIDLEKNLQGLRSACRRLKNTKTG